MTKLEVPFEESSCSFLNSQFRSDIAQKPRALSWMENPTEKYGYCSRTFRLTTPVICYHNLNAKASMGGALLEQLSSWHYEIATTTPNDSARGLRCFQLEKIPKLKQNCARKFYCFSSVFLSNAYGLKINLSLSSYTCSKTECLINDA